MQQRGHEIAAKIAIVPCKWHPLTAMENAARDGYCHDADTVVMSVKCTGLVKVSYLLKLFAKGFEGVLVLGCPEGDCHYYNGSQRCGEIIEETREILEIAGVPGRRLGFHLISESRGKEFRRVLDGFIRQLKGSGKRVSKKQTKRRGRVASVSHR